MIIINAELISYAILVMREGSSWVKRRVMESLSVKKKIVKSATEAATMILKIDYVTVSSRVRQPSTPKGLLQEGMGEF